MINLSKREKRLSVWAVALAATAICYNFLIEPIILKWKGYINQIEAKTIQFKKNQQLLADYEALQEEYKRYPALLEAGKSEEKEIAGALNEIENISQKSACYIIDIKPRTSKKIGFYMELSFDLTTEGTINEFMRFIFEIETTKKLLKIKRFIITSKSGSPGRLKGVFLLSKIII